MDLGSMFLILALLLLVALFVARPFFEKDAAYDRPMQAAIDADEHARSSLLAEHERLLNALQELDFDHTLGKIPAQDYPQQRQLLLKHGADVLRQLDGLRTSGAVAVESSSTAGAADAALADDAEARLEAAIAVHRADAAVARHGGNGRKNAIATAASDDAVETLLASRRRERREKAAGFCSRCGGALQKSDRFCPKCGAKSA